MDPLLIARGLPHRYPFVLVDKIVDIEYMKRSKGMKNISANEPWVQGHFPEEPVYPGVLMIETMAQVGGFIFYNAEEPNPMPNLRLCAVNNVKIVRVVQPGDVLIVEAELTDSIASFHQLKCEARVEGQLVVSGTVTLAEMTK